MKTTSNTYDFNLVNDICNYYIYKCILNNKEVSILGFSILTSINDSVIYEWGNNYANRLKREASNKGSEIYKTLRKYNEETIASKLDNVRNPVGLIAKLNHYHGWNNYGERQEVSRLTNRTAEQIAESYGKDIEKGAELPKLPN